MLVFLVPVGADRYELYCEEPEEVLPADEAPSGVFRRLVHWFREMLAEAERERRRGPSTDAPPAGFMSRLKARTRNRSPSSGFCGSFAAGSRRGWSIRTIFAPSRRSRSSVVPSAATSSAIDSGL